MTFTRCSFEFLNGFSRSSVSLFISLESLSNGQRSASFAVELDIVFGNTKGGVEDILVFCFDAIALDLQKDFLRVLSLGPVEVEEGEGEVLEEFVLLVDGFVLDVPRFVAGKIRFPPSTLLCFLLQVLKIDSLSVDLKKSVLELATIFLIVDSDFEIFLVFSNFVAK